MINSQKPSNIDPTDKALLIALQENARRSYADLGRTVGLTATAVAERVRKLEETGLITGYHAAVSLDKLGHPMAIIVRLRIPQFASHEIVEQMLLIPEVVSCSSVTGEDCLMVRFVASSMQHMRGVLEQIGKFGHTTTLIELFGAEKVEIVKSLLAST